jgi:hypothetical protein
MAGRDAGLLAPLLAGRLGRAPGQLGGDVVILGNEQRDRPRVVRAASPDLRARR